MWLREAGSRGTVRLNETGKQNKARAGGEDGAGRVHWAASALRGEGRLAMTALTALTAQSVNTESRGFYQKMVKTVHFMLLFYHVKESEEIGRVY